ASTQSRTASKAGNAATTAPKPTRLATLRAGSTDAFAPASMVSRRPGSRWRLSRTTVATAAASAVMTDQTPATPAGDVAPHLSSARNARSSRGSTTKDIRTLTAMTTTSGATATATGGSLALWQP